MKVIWYASVYKALSGILLCEFNIWMLYFCGETKVFSHLGSYCAALITMNKSKLSCLHHQVWPAFSTCSLTSKFRPRLVIQRSPCESRASNLRHFSTPRRSFSLCCFLRRPTTRSISVMKHAQRYRFVSFVLACSFQLYF